MLISHKDSFFACFLTGLFGPSFTGIKPTGAHAFSLQTYWFGRFCFAGLPFDVDGPASVNVLSASSDDESNIVIVDCVFEDKRRRRLVDFAASLEDAALDKGDVCEPISSCTISSVDTLEATGNVTGDPERTFGGMASSLSASLNSLIEDSSTSVFMGQLQLPHLSPTSRTEALSTGNLEASQEERSKKKNAP
jgi:hypothetical protein